MKQVFFDGQKAHKISINALPDEAWTYIKGGSDKGDKKQELYQSIPWLFRGIKLRTDAVSSMPFAIFQGENEIDNNQDYQNTVGFLPNPLRILQLIEASLTLIGTAYVLKQENLLGNALGLRYMLPTSIEPLIDESVGLTGFIRHLGGNIEIPLEIDDLLYFWITDPFVEIGPPMSSPAKAAMNAAGVLFNVDEFTANFFERGAIKATILGVPMGTSQVARQELKGWWNKVIKGVKNAFGAQIIEADSVKPTVIGEGIQELSNVELTREKREDIGTALGIPHTLLFSNAANFATAQQDDKHFYDKTVVPECQFIQGVLNEQLFNPMGYTFKFQPETLDIFQEDENRRSQSLNQLVASGLPLDIGLDILGFELTDEQWEILTGEDDEGAALMVDSARALNGAQVESALTIITQQAQGAIPKEIAANMLQVFFNLTAEQAASLVSDQIRLMPEEVDINTSRSAVAAELRKWRKKAINHAGKPKARRFESDLIPPALSGAIAGALAEAQTEPEIAAVFDDIWQGYP